MKFISKRANASFEGCAFKHFLYQTDDKYKINKLRTSSWYGKGFTELSQDEENEILTKTGSELNADELQRLLERRRNAETTEYEEYSYEDLKTEAKDKGMKWKGFPKKKDLIRYLNES